MKQITKKQLAAYRAALIYETKKPLSNWHGDKGHYWSLRDAWKRLVRLLK